MAFIASSKPLVSHLWGCGESVNPPKLNIQEVQGDFVRETKGRRRPATHFFRSLYFCQITPLRVIDMRILSRVLMCYPVTAQLLKGLSRLGLLFFRTYDI